MAAGPIDAPTATSAAIANLWGIVILPLTAVGCAAPFLLIDRSAGRRLALPLPLTARNPAVITSSINRGETTQGSPSMAMKIWYQSMSRFETKWKSYPKYLRQILDQVKDPDTEIEIHGITKIGGFADQYRYLEYLETGEVMENVHTAMAQGFDAFLIGNIADPGIRECREIANFPVLGLCETSLHVACMMGANFSLVTINEKFTPRIVENVVHYGLKDRLAAVNRMKTDRILNLDEGFENLEVQRDLIGQFQN